MKFISTFKDLTSPAPQRPFDSEFPKGLGDEEKSRQFSYLRGWGDATAFSAEDSLEEAGAVCTDANQ